MVHFHFDQPIVQHARELRKKRPGGIPAPDDNAGPAQQAYAANGDIDPQRTHSTVFPNPFRDRQWFVKIEADLIQIFRGI